MQAFPLIDVAVSVLGEEAFLQIARVLGSSLARIAEAEIATFALTVGAPLVQRGGSDLAMAQASVNVAQILPMMTRVIDVLHRRHIEAAIRRLAFTREGLGLQPAASPMAIGFADMAGYTALSRWLTIEELADLLSDFSALVADTVTAMGGRVVKLIGDEVMFAAPAAAIACEIAIALRHTFAENARMPPLRIGLAYGTVLTRDGDYYGTVVNLAARAAAAAESGRTLVDRDARAAVPADSKLSFSSAGPFDLKGFGEPIELHELAPPAR